MRFLFLLVTAVLASACKTAPKSRWPGAYEGLLSFDLYCSDITSMRHQERIRWVVSQKERRLTIKTNYLYSCDELEADVTDKTGATLLAKRCPSTPTIGGVVVQATITKGVLLLRSDRSIQVLMNAHGELEDRVRRGICDGSASGILARVP